MHFFSTNILICNLALADLLFLTFCVPLTAYSYVYSWRFSDTVCYITVTLQYLTCYVSVWTLVLLAYDRFIVGIVFFGNLLFLKIIEILVDNKSGRFAEFETRQRSSLRLHCSMAPRIHGHFSTNARRRRDHLFL